MDARRRIRSDERGWVLEGDEGREARRAHIPDDEPHIVAMHLDLASDIDPAVLLRDDAMTIYVFTEDGAAARDHATVNAAIR